jgi:hypothetical protein
MADIFDHIFSSIKYFDLEIFELSNIAEDNQETI